MKRTKMLQKCLMLLLVFTLGVTLLAGCANKVTNDEETVATTVKPDNSNDTTTKDDPSDVVEDSGMVSDVPVTFTMLYEDNAVYPYKEDWMILDEITKRTNVSLDLQIVPSSDFRDRRTILIGSGDIPDILGKTFDDQIDAYTTSGIFLPISDYVDKMPTLTNFIQDYGYGEDLENLKSVNGKYYVLPAYCNSIRNNYHTWHARLDIFEELDLELPETMEDVYEACKAYKEAYPDKTPMTNRYREDNILFKVAPAFNTQAGWGLGNTFILDKEQDKFIFAPASEGYKQMLIWFNKMVSEGLLDEEFATLDETIYTERAYNGEQFLLVGWIGNEIDWNREGPAQSENPDYNIQPIMPPKGPWGHYSGARIPKFDQSMAFSSNVADYDNFDTFLRFIDWFYTEEAAELTTFGLEGETFEILEDGRKEYIDLTKNYSPSHGILNNCLTIRKDDDYAKSNKTEYVSNLIQKMETEGVFDPVVPKLKLTDEGKETEALYKQPIIDYVRQMTLQFIYGEASIEDDWDDFIAECKSKGVDKLDELYNETWKNQ